MTENRSTCFPPELSYSSLYKEYFHLKKLKRMNIFTSLSCKGSSTYTGRRPAEPVFLQSSKTSSLKYSAMMERRDRQSRTWSSIHGWRKDIQQKQSRNSFRRKWKKRAIIKVIAQKNQPQVEVVSNHLKWLKGLMIIRWKR